MVPDDDFEGDVCPLCRDVLFKPAVLPCGHVFCKACIGDIETHSQTQHNAKCPVCRRILPSVQDLAECHLLTSLLEEKHAEAYQRRRKEYASHTYDTEVLPIFVLDTILPLQHMRLYIYEPRYKLMIQRVLASGGKARFGMIGHNPTTGAQMKKGTELLVTECLRRNGCYFVETVAQRVFETKEKWMQDEYLCAKVCWEKEDVPEDTETLMSEEELMEKKGVWERLVVEGGWQSASQLATTRMQLGKAPKTLGQQALWLGALLNPLPAIDAAADIRPFVIEEECAKKRYTLVTNELEASIARLQTENNSKLKSLRRALQRYAITRYMPLFVAILLIDMYIRWRSSGEIEEL